MNSARTPKRYASKQHAQPPSADGTPAAPPTVGRAATLSVSATDNRPPLLEVNGLGVRFRTAVGTINAVRELHLTIARGETVAIVGESGSGKSVTAQALLKLLPANATVNYDAISFDGQRLDQLDNAALRRYRGGSVGMIFQEPASSFDPLYPIGKTLCEAISAHNPTLPNEAIARRATELLGEIGIEDAKRRLHNYPHQFSGGQLQRIGLALAIAADPELLIADEPTTALDVTVQAEIMALLKRIIRTRSLSVIFISHDITLVTTIADRIAVMYGGCLLELGAAADITNAPHHPYSAALLKSLIPLGAHYRDGALRTIRGTPPSPFTEPPGCPFADRCDFVQGECHHALPPLRTDDGPTVHRCLIRGVKGKKVK